MKSFLAGAICVIAGVALMGATARDPDKIVLRSPNGKKVLTLQATDSVVGMWISQDHDRDGFVSIYFSDDDDPVVGLYGPRNVGPSLQMDAGLSVKRGPTLQYTKDGKIKTVPLEKLDSH